MQASLSLIYLKITAESSNDYHKYLVISRLAFSKNMSKPWMTMSYMYHV